LSTRPDSTTEAGGGGRGPAEGLFATHWGEGLVAVWHGRLVGVELPPVRGAIGAERHGAASREDQDAVRRWVGELEAYFRGERLSWRTEEIGLDGEDMSPFALRTVEALLGVPAGSTVSYGELAERAGFPRAARAVGSVMANNPIPIVVPCHRVIRSDGSLGRYGTEPAWKEWLLTHERSNVQRG
jgi:methylated-DNA-[protein]-cysteine S-methyltransferase